MTRKQCPKCGKVLNLFNRDLASDLCAACRSLDRKTERQKREAAIEEQRIAEAEAEERREDYASNLFRDGGLLVVSATASHFPNRCVLTNLPVGSARFDYREAIPKKARLLECAGSVTGSVLGGLFSLAGPFLTLASADFLELHFGLDRSIQARYHRRKRTALGLVFGGMLAPFILMVPLFTTIGAHLSPAAKAIMPVVDLAVRVLVFAGPACMLLGLAYFAVAVRPVLRIKKADSQFVWLEGAHVEFLSSLREWGQATKGLVEYGSSGERIVPCDIKGR